MANSWVQYIGTTVRQESPAGKLGIAGVFTVQPGDVISVPADVATYLTTNESSLWQAAADPTQAARHLTIATTTSPTATVAAGAGTSPPAPVLVGNDAKGQVTFGTGTSPGTGAQVTVTFQTPFATGTIPRPVICAANAATAALQPYVVQQGQTGFQIALGTAPSASQGNTTYAVTYHVIG